MPGTRQPRAQQGALGDRGPHMVERPEPRSALVDRNRERAGKAGRSFSLSKRLLACGLLPAAEECNPAHPQGSNPSDKK